MGNFWNDFSVEDMEKTGFYRCVYGFSVNYNSIGVDDNLNINKF